VIFQDFPDPGILKKKSRTFHDLKLQFPGLSRTKVIFEDFPGPGILKKKSRTFQEAWEKAYPNPKHILI